MHMLDVDIILSMCCLQGCYYCQDFYARLLTEYIQV
jgi:hypothetical protein